VRVRADGATVPSRAALDHLSLSPWEEEEVGAEGAGGDPAGTWVDVVQQIDPAPGFWDQYPA
jgi:hypothetical protein